MRKLASLIAATTLISGTAGAQVLTRLEPASEEHPIDSTTQAQDIAFRVEQNNRLTVAVDVAGRGPYRFLVDTGADRTVVSREMVQRLQLASGPTANLHSITGMSQVGTAKVPHLKISSRDVRSVEAAVLSATNLGADGVLGTDSLRSQRVLFDFKNRILSITPAVSRAPRFDGDAIVIEAQRKSGRLIVTEAEANNHPLNVVVDTGSEVTIGNSALRKALLGRQLKPNGTVEVQSVTGEKLTGDYLILKELKIGGITLRDLNIVFTDVHTFKQMKLTDKPSLLLGMNAMRAFDKVSIDFARRKLQVLMPKASEIAPNAQLAMR